MKLIILWSTIVFVSATKISPPPRSVNVALETSFLFDPKDIDENRSFVNNIRGFLDKLYKILEPAHNEKHYRAERKPHITEGSSNFIEILKNIGNHFVNMPNGKIKEAVNTIHGEVTKIADNKKGGSKIKEITDENIKEIMKDSIDDWLKSNPDEMRQLINTTITEDSPILKTFVRRINTYFNEDDVKKLNKIFKKFRKNIENDLDNSKVIKDLLHNAIFKKYNSLNESAKGALLSDLKMISNFLVTKNMFSGLNDNLSVLTRRNIPAREKDDTSISAVEDNLTYTALRRSIDEKLRDVKEKKDDVKKENVNEKKESTGSEIFVDNVEIFVEPPKNQ